MASSREEIIKDIKIYMINEDLNQQGLAEELGYSRQWLNTILNNKAEAPKELLELIYKEHPHQAEIDAISEIQNKAIAENNS